MQGICCGCQSPQDIQLSNLPANQMADLGWDAEDMDRCFGDDHRYVVMEHDFHGQRCDGSGLVPQAIIRPTLQTDGYKFNPMLNQDAIKAERAKQYNLPESGERFYSFLDPKNRDEMAAAYKLHDYGPRGQAETGISDQPHPGVGITDEKVAMRKIQEKKD